MRADFVLFSLMMSADMSVDSALADMVLDDGRLCFHMQK